MFKKITPFFHKSKQRFTLLFKHVRHGNVRVFFICLFCATMLWFFNSLNHLQHETINYPIEVVYDTKKYIALEPNLRYIMLRVKGTGWQILWKTLSLKSEPIKIYTPSVISSNNSYLLTNRYEVDIKRQLSGLEVENIITDTIPIRLDKKIKRRYFLNINPFDINLKTNYRIVSEIEVTPKQVLLEGPESYLERIPNPFPVIIPQRNINNDFEKDVKLYFPIQNPDLISSNVKDVKIEFKVEEYLYKTTSLVVRLIHFPEKSGLTLNRNHRRVDITYAFRSKDIGKIRLSDFLLVADFKTFNIQDSTVVLFLKRRPDFISKDDISFKSKVKLDYEKK